MNKKLLIVSLGVALLTALPMINASRSTEDSSFVSKFQYQLLKEGDGVSYPKQGDTVTVHYVGTNQGKKFDSSRDRGTPFKFNLGRGQVIQCWDMVVSQMSYGEKAFFVCPSALAYGARGAGNVIPPNADIAFEVELLDFSSRRHGDL